MIYNLSKKIAFYFVKQKIVPQDEVDVYRFGIETILCALVDIIIALEVGMLYGEPWYALCYIVIFATLRQFVDGYHAKTFWGCKLMMFVMMVEVMSIVLYTKQEFVLIICGMIILFLIFKCEISCRKGLLATTFLAGAIILYCCERSLAVLLTIAFLIVMFAALIKNK